VRGATVRGATTEGEAGAGTPVAGRGVSCGLGFGVTAYAGFTVREGSLLVPGRAGAGVVGVILKGSTRGVGLDHPDCGVAGRATGGCGVTARFSDCRGEIIDSRPVATLAGSAARTVFCGSARLPAAVLGRAIVSRDSPVRALAALEPARMLRGADEGPVAVLGAVVKLGAIARSALRARTTAAWAASELETRLACR
jgi:hypothetical protein